MVKHNGDKVKVVFVCLGNICRSPLAESIFRHMAEQRGVDQYLEIDSAGTGGWHIGHPPDERSVETARGRGITVTGKARKFVSADLDRFDCVIAMDEQNVADIESVREVAGEGTKVHRLREWDDEPGDMNVPDPYYGGQQGFEDVHDIVERSCQALLDDIIERHELG